MTSSADGRYGDWNDQEREALQQLLRMTADQSVQVDRVIEIWLKLGQMPGYETAKEKLSEFVQESDCLRVLEGTVRRTDL